MAELSHAPDGARYQDQRHYVVPASLGELRGPTHGVVSLDRQLDWSADPRYDLDDPGDLQVMYQTVMNEAASVEQLRRWLDGSTLRRIWRTLWLPSRLRAQWENRLPDLAGSSSIPAA
jgi:hypothetical protein